MPWATYTSEPSRSGQGLLHYCKTATDTSYLYETLRLYDEKVRFLAENCQRVLDFGKSYCERYTFFAPGQIVTSDLNQYDDYPDVADDICDIRNLEWGSFDGIVCLSILEHVYAPHLACENLFRLLKSGGYVLVYVRYVWKYHAPVISAIKTTFVSPGRPRVPV